MQKDGDQILSVVKVCVYQNGQCFEEERIARVGTLFVTYKFP